MMLTHGKEANIVTFSKQDSVQRGRNQQKSTSETAARARLAMWIVDCARAQAHKARDRHGYNLY